MPIISSQTIPDVHEQASGARYVIERHTDGDGNVYQCGPYLAPQGYDINARLASRAAELNAQLADAEATALLGQ